MLDIIKINRVQPALYSIGHVIGGHSTDSGEQFEMLTRCQIRPKKVILLAFSNYSPNGLRVGTDGKFSNADVPIRCILCATEEINKCGFA
jgi:hypothetical protein